MYYFSKLNWIMAAVCSRMFVQKMAWIKWMLVSLCDKQDSQRKWQKHGCRLRSARPCWSVYKFFWRPLYTCVYIREPNKDPPGRLSRDFRTHKLERCLLVGRGKKKYPARQCKVWAAHKKRSEARYICKFCVVPRHKGRCFEKYHSVMNY
jgi:hypothetical protein